MTNLELVAKGIALDIDMSGVIFLLLLKGTEVTSVEQEASEASATILAKAVKTEHIPYGYLGLIENLIKQAYLEGYENGLEFAKDSSKYLSDYLNKKAAKDFNPDDSTRET